MWMASPRTTTSASGGRQVYPGLQKYKTIKFVLALQSLTSHGVGGPQIIGAKAWASTSHRHGAHPSTQINMAGRVEGHARPTSQERKRARVDGASATDGGGVSAAAAHPLPQAGPELAEEAPPGTAEVASRTSAAKVPEGAAKSTARKPPPRTLAILAGGGTVIYTPAQYISFGITHTKYNGGHLSGSAAYG